MLGILLLLRLIVLSALVSSGGLAAYLAAGGESIGVVRHGAETVLILNALPGERLSYPAFGDLKLVFVSSLRGLVQHDIVTDESIVLSEKSTGAPWISSSGDLWYTQDGYLFMNGASTGVSIPAFSVSVENGVVAFTDRNDDLHIFSLENGEDLVFSGYRFFSPVVLTNGDVIAPTLTGEIIHIPSGDIPAVVGNGEQPCWSYELDGLFYCISEDDGHSITAADIWFVRPGGEPVQITFTSDLLETRPACSGGILWFVHSGNGIPDCVRLDALPL